MAYWLDKEQPTKKTDQRKGPDGITKFVKFTSFTSWLLIVISIVVTDAARPSSLDVAILDSKWGKTATNTFRSDLVTVGMFVCFVAVMFAIIGLAANSQRHKRKTDKYSIALITAFIVGLIGSSAYIFFLFT